MPSAVVFVFAAALGTDRHRVAVAALWIATALLAIAVLYMGIFPFPFTQIMDASVADLLKHVAMTKLK